MWGLREQIKELRVALEKIRLTAKAALPDNGHREYILEQCKVLDKTS